VAQERVYVPLEDELRRDVEGHRCDRIAVGDAHGSATGVARRMRTRLLTGRRWSRSSARRIPGTQHDRRLRASPAQLQMAEAVHDAFAKHHHTVVEAGTGTGKTLAYLLPRSAAGGG